MIIVYIVGEEEEVVVERKIGDRVQDEYQLFPLVLVGLEVENEREVEQNGKVKQADHTHWLVS